MSFRMSFALQIPVHAPVSICPPLVGEKILISQQSRRYAACRAITDSDMIPPFKRVRARDALTVT